MSNVIIIGAPRSGTNMLRNVLTSFEGVGTWPCDEINYIWRHGNVRYPTDELPVSLATDKVARYIRGKFAQIRAETGASIVVEKTCANSLRVPFVDKCVPDARYIYIYRDGIDATGSGALRWTAKFDARYIFAKARFVPPLDFPYYAFRYLYSRIYRGFSSEKRLASWGPVIKDMQGILRSHSLNEVCALQWQRCVELAEVGLAALPQDRVFRVKYESFVSDPLMALSGICSFLGLRHDEGALTRAVSGVSGRSVGKGRSTLGDHEVSRLEQLVGRTLEHYGYPLNGCSNRE